MPSGNKNSSSTKNSNQIGNEHSPFIQRNNFMVEDSQKPNPKATSTTSQGRVGSSQKTQQSSGTGGNFSGSANQPRSSSTKVRPSSSTGEKHQSSSGAGNSSSHLNKKSSNDRINSSQKADDPQPTSSSHRLTKLSQQNVTQPRRREPTSRVAPKN